MSFRTRFQRRATLELSEAAAWYEEKSKGLGHEFVRAVDAAIASITRNPFAYPTMRYHVRRMLLRRFPYSIMYRVSADEIVIVSIWHGRRNPRRWQTQV